MKPYTLLTALTWFGLLISSSGVAQTPTPVAANGRLKLVGTQLSAESGRPVQLRGISSHGLQWFDQCYTQASIQALTRDWGIDVFRAAMYVDEGGYLNNQSGLRSKIDQIVDWTGQAGIYCIIDWHVLNPGNPNERLSYAIDFFRTMAQKHAGKKHVIYEIANEPNGVDWNTIKAYADQVIPVIRQYDPQAIILCGTPNWCQRPQDVLANPLTGANAYNVMYTFHYYAASHFFQGDIRSVTNALPLFCSEWGTSTFTGNGNLDFSNGQAWMDLKAGQNPGGQKISWCNWSFSQASESSAALNQGACDSQSWNNTSPSGTWVKSRILSPADDFGPATPSVALTSPATNTTVVIGSSVVLTASVSNATATTVEFYNGTTLLGQDTSAPYSWTMGNVQGGTYAIAAKALLSSGNALTSPTVTITAASAPNQVPTAMLTAPANGSSFAGPANVTLTANASDPDGSIANVAFYNGNQKLGEDATSPYSFVWSGVAFGTYTLTVRATDNQGLVATSSAVTITVNDPNAPQGDIVGPPCVAVNDVKTYAVGSANLASATSFSWWSTGSTQSITTPQPGQASINFGPSFSGGQVCVGINYSAAPWYKQVCKDVTVCTGTSPQPPTPPVNQAPTVALTSPANNASFTAPATINLTATASDADGTVAKVEFFNGATKLGEATTSPYQFTWSNVGAGTYSVSAKATDNQGATASSVPITVSVTATAPPAPPTGNADLNGPDFVNVNDVKTYALNTMSLTNATNFSWWFTGSTRSITASAGRATIDFGSSFTGGEVCVGVNYSAAPWYRQLCKRVQLTGSGGRLAAEEVVSVVYPNPATSQFLFTAGHDVQTLRVVDLVGRGHFTHGPVQKGQSVTFGEDFPAGHYLLQIRYAADRQQTVKLLKIGK